MSQLETMVNPPLTMKKNYLDRALRIQAIRNRQLIKRDTKLKVTKRQLRRIIKEEKRKLIREQDAIPPRDEHVDTYYDDDAYGQDGAMSDEMAGAVQDAILELFVLHGEVRTNDVYDHLRQMGFDDADIDGGLMAIGEMY